MKQCSVGSAHCFMKRLKLMFLLSLVLSCSLGCAKEDRKLIIFYAGSLARPMRELASEFEKVRPGVKILMEASGSVIAARKVSEINREADVIALADYKIIENVLMPEHATWYVKFAGNSVVIVFTERSRYGDEVNSDNWYKILSRKDVRFGRSNRDLDPCGYRTLMVWQLADLFYKDRIDGKSIYEALDENCPEDNTRPGSVELLPLLESLYLDYAFEYLSVARQHHLKYVELPVQIDLSDPDLEELYEMAQVSVTGRRPGDYEIVKGSPIAYGVTIPKDAPHLSLAVEFVGFLLGDVGQRIMERNGQSPMVPAIAKGFSHVPEELKQYVVEK